MGADNLLQRIKTNTNELDGKKSWALAIRFDLTNEVQKQMASDINEIIQNSGASGNEVAQELIEEGLKVFRAKVEEAQKETKPSIALKKQ